MMLFLNFFKMKGTKYSYAGSFAICKQLDASDP